MNEIQKIKAIETIQCFSDATQLEAKIIDIKGKSIFSCGEDCSDHGLCSSVSQSACRKSHLFGAAQSLRFDNSYIFFCPIGLVHFVSPVIEKNKMVGALISGHFLMTEPDVYLIQQLMATISDERIIRDFVQNVRVYDPKQVKALAELLKLLSAGLSDGTEIKNLQNQSDDHSDAKHQHSIYKVIDFIKSNYMNKITLEQAAEEVYFTPQYLSKIFKEETGYTFSQYLSHIRVDRSKQLLQQDDLNHTEIALMTGFADQSHFSRSFKKVTGISPKTYRISHSIY